MTFNDAIKKMLETNDNGQSEFDKLVNNNANRLYFMQDGAADE